MMPHSVTLSVEQGLSRWATRCFAAAQHDTRGKSQGEAAPPSRAVIMKITPTGVGVHGKVLGRAPVPAGDHEDHPYGCWS